MRHCLLFATAQKTGPAFIHPIEEDENDEFTVDDTFPPSGAFHNPCFLTDIQLKHDSCILAWSLGVQFYKWFGSHLGKNYFGDFGPWNHLSYICIFSKFANRIANIAKQKLLLCQNKMKQLDVDVSPPAFLWDPHLNLANMTFDLDPCDLWPYAQVKYAKYTTLTQTVLEIWIIVQ